MVRSSEYFFLDEKYSEENNGLYEDTATQEDKPFGRLCHHVNHGETLVRIRDMEQGHAQFSFAKLDTHSCTVTPVQLSLLLVKGAAAAGDFFYLRVIRLK